MEAGTDTDRASQAHSLSSLSNTSKEGRGKKPKVSFKIINQRATHQRAAQGSSDLRLGTTVGFWVHYRS